MSTLIEGNVHLSLTTILLTLLATAVDRFVRGKADASTSTGSKGFSRTVKARATASGSRRETHWQQQQQQKQKQAAQVTSALISNSLNYKPQLRNVGFA
ncbi:hypothetical protein AAFF_G00388840 [Aldrovandia affinis]|uniref:Secreted protein n=1 Tax=Aldrovandia affinis TaxID=143900 RepID=A0AAD7SEQ8_9TELE|nr:hypothetical protein AAFF_G00388840 [Aldrovandia affinis]